MYKDGSLLPNTLNFLYFPDYDPGRTGYFVPLIPSHSPVINVITKMRMSKRCQKPSSPR